MTNLPSPCEVAQTRYFQALRWLNLWKVLLYIFGATVVLFSVAAIVLFIRSSFLPGAITTVGTIVSGAGIAWVVNQRTTAATEEKDAFLELKSACGAGRAAFVGVTEQTLLRNLKDAAWKSLFRAP
jgi:O-acetylhomoserine/O-acetylserine sulfhydrylase-like pyridoxal-dependent enzyme